MIVPDDDGADDPAGDAGGGAATRSHPEPIHPARCFCTTVGKQLDERASALASRLDIEPNMVSTVPASPRRPPSPPSVVLLSTLDDELNRPASIVRRRLIYRAAH